MNLKCLIMKTDRLNIIGITVCVNYSPILALTLEQNTKKLKHIYVVTKECDHNTIKVCKKYDNVTMLTHNFKITDNWYDVKLRRCSTERQEHKDIVRCPTKIDNMNGKAFNKGGALRAGQLIAERLFPDDYYLVMDCDVTFGQILTRSLRDVELEMDYLYVPGQRRDYSTYDDYIRKTNHKVYPGGSAGWGFFQLYKCTEPTHYEDWHTAAKCDTWFRNDVIKNNHSNIRKLKGWVNHLGEEGASTFLQNYKFKM